MHGSLPPPPLHRSGKSSEITSPQDTWPTLAGVLCWPGPGDKGLGVVLSAWKVLRMGSLLLFLLFEGPPSASGVWVSMKRAFLLQTPYGEDVTLSLQKLALHNLQTKEPCFPECIPWNPGPQGGAAIGMKLSQSSLLN